MIEKETMNKNEFWDTIKDLFDKADNGELGTVGDGFGYVDKETYNSIEIDYTKFGLDFNALIALLEELDKDGFIEFVNTNNMCYLVYKNKV